MSASCETERFETYDRFAEATKRWMLLTHRDTAARAMVWFEMPDKPRNAPVGIAEVILGHLEEGKDISVGPDDTVRMRDDPS